MLEVEMKFPVEEFTALQGRLQQRGARRTAVLREADHYFSAPDRDFARTDEALRLRRIGPANFVTYKGPKLDAQTKTRTEIEVPLADGETAAKDFARLLVHLGYRPVAVVSKERQVYALSQGAFALQVCLDDVADVGRYAELEIMAPEEQMEEARRVLMELAADFGLAGSERRSYLELLLAARGEASP